MAAETSAQFGKMSKVFGHIGYMGIGVDVGYRTYTNYIMHNLSRNINSYWWFGKYEAA